VHIGPVPCSSDEFQCANYQCVRASFYCDGADDCGDASDEPDSCGKCSVLGFQKHNCTYICFHCLICSNTVTFEKCPIATTICLFNIGVKFPTVFLYLVDESQVCNTVCILNGLN